jgi:adenine-specific DNA-methyltransferase
MVIHRPERPRDELQAHYTSSPEIVRYMVSRLRPEPGDSIWEPSAGEGHLIDGVLAVVPSARIRASEIDSLVVTALHEKYRACSNVDVHCEDALDLENGNLFQDQLHFTRVLANPPYGAYLTPARRADLKKRYPSLYVKETYGIILYHSLRMVSDGGRLVFIVPDTFLWLHRHVHLRKTLLNETTIEEIVLFPSKFFPGINFGYSGLCIITLAKRPPSNSHNILIVERIRDTSVLLDCAGGQYPSDRCSTSRVSQIEIGNRANGELMRAQGDAISTTICRPLSTLGDFAEVRTGFYSGNDRRWVRRAHGFVPRSANYKNVDLSLVSRLDSPPVDGINDSQSFIPIVRGGAASFVRRTLWYVDWSVTAVSEYTRRGKNPARFQNSQFYFKEGIGLPMVASARLTGALLEKRLFDQGIVGVFPNDERHLLYFLGFLNTDLATSLLREINPTANNSANYIKRLPMVLPNADELDVCNRLVLLSIDEARSSKIISRRTTDELESIYRLIWSKAVASIGAT